MSNVPCLAAIEIARQVVSSSLVQLGPTGYGLPSSNQRLIVIYQYYSQDGNTEHDTKITWWRKRPDDPATYFLSEDPEYPGLNFQQMTYENIETVGITSRHFPEYNNRTIELGSDVGAQDWFKTNDLIRVKVTPSDGISYGNTVESNATTLSSAIVPYVTNVSISAVGLTENPPDSGQYYVPSGTELDAYYVYTDANGTITFDGTPGTSIVNWYLNDSAMPYLIGPVIAAGIIQSGQAYNFIVTPCNGVPPNAQFGVPIMSQTVVVQ